MSTADTNPELDRIVADYLQADSSGDPPDRAALVRQHPELASQLRSFFASHDRIKQAVKSNAADAAAADKATLPPNRPGSDTATRALPSDAGPDTPIAATGDYSTRSRLPQTDETVGAGGKYFGDYELVEEIARGGMGVVFKARQLSLNRIVALKMILSGQLASSEDVIRFHAEAEAAANLEHPGIVPIHEVGESQGQHYFTMGYIDGKSLADSLRDRRPAPREAAVLIKKVAEAVAYAHQRGVIHRDLKPANILIDAHGEPKITDFGLAKKMDDDSALTATGQILGTPAYMPPEQAAGKVHQVNEASDVYALGAILYALLTSRPPFESPNPLDTLVQVLESEATLPTKLDRAIPRQLELVCMRCLEKQQRDRYPSAQALADDLGRFLQDEPVQARPANLWQRLRRRGRREPALVAHLVGLAMALTIVQITFLLIGTDLAYHLRHTVLLIGWAAVALLFQQVVNRPSWTTVGSIGWAVADAVLFTAVLVFAAPPVGALLIGYPLLVTASGLFFRVHLVVVMTAACAASYIGLQFLQPDQAETPLHYSVIFATTLIVVGGIVATQVRRIRRLSEYYENQA